MSYAPPPADLSRFAPAAAPRLGGIARVTVGLTGVVLLGLLITAARLTPDPRGLGTHRQLGLPPCTIVAWFGIRCPSCGMTTAWSHMVRGQVASAVRANSGGALLALAAMVAGPWFVGSAARGRWLISPPRDMVLIGAGLTVVIVTIVDWTLRLAFG
jgi:hypothetical protein